MGTVVLSIVGSALGGPVGGVIGGLVGGFFDQQFLFPALFGAGDSPASSPIQGPRVSDIQVVGFSDGAPMSVAIGESCRVPATVIYVSNLKETAHVQTSSVQTGGGGKGGLGNTPVVNESTVTTYTYSVDIALAFCDTKDLGALVSFKKILIDGKTLWEKFNDTAVAANTNLAFQNRQTIVWEPIPSALSGITYQKRVVFKSGYVISDVDSGGPDLTELGFHTDVEVVISGSSEADNNGSFVLTEVEAIGDKDCAQVIDLDSPTGGTFTITFDGNTTGNIDYDATNAAVTTALEGLPNVAVGDVLVSDSPFVGDWSSIPGGSDKSWEVAFKNNLGDSPQPLMSIDTSLITHGSIPNRTFISSVTMSNPGSPANGDALRFHGVEFVPIGFGDSVVLDQTVPNLDPRLASSIQLEKGWNDPGSGAQQQDVLTELEARVGAAPHFVNTAVCFIEDLQLAEFGNRVPSTISGILDASRGVDHLGDAIKKVLQRGGWVNGVDFDVSEVDGEFSGYQWIGIQSTARVLEPLMVAFQIDAKDEEGVIRFFKRGNEDIVAIDVDDLGAHSESEPSPGKLVIRDVGGIELPSGYIIKHLNTSKDLQPASQPYNRANRPGFAPEVVEFDTNISMGPGKAKSLAKRLTWEPAQDSREGAVTLPPSLVQLSVGTILDITNDSGESFKIRLIDIERGDNFLMNCVGFVLDPPIEEITSVADPEEDDSTSPYVPPITVLALMDVPALDNEQIESFGYYYGMAAASPSAEWAGGELYSSSDDVVFSLLAAIPNESTMGEADEAIGEASPHYWDYANSVDVTLDHGTLESKTAAEVLSGSNRALLGSEVIGFQTATLVSGTTYTLSNLLRGLRDTRSEISNHQPFERFVLLDSSTLNFQSIGSGAVDVSVYMKSIGLSGDESTVPSVLFTPTGRTQLCFSPAGFQSVPDPSTGDIVFSWHRRPRSIGRILSTTGNMAVEDNEQYEIDIVNASGTVLRTISVSDSTTVTYTAAQISTDGLGSTEFTAVAFQIGSALGRGTAASITVAASGFS